MHLHEYQTKNLLREKGIAVPDFVVISSMEEMWHRVENEGWTEGIIKAQVHAGGRGKAGGVKRAQSREELIAFTEEMIGMHLVTPQTGAEGVIVQTLLLSKPVTIEKEYYVALTIDRKTRRPTLLLSPEGGVEIEEIAATHPEKILNLPLHRWRPIRSYQHRLIAKTLGWTGEVAEEGAAILDRLHALFLEVDASLLEINPLVLTAENQLSAIDAKGIIDENALFRQPQLAALEDQTFLTPEEKRAKAFDLAYVRMEGEIGCLVNGAGLAMATMDLIHYYGGKPANFLDVGGSASQEKITEGFHLLLSDRKVRAIFVNIFGGILNCVTLAAGILTALADEELRLPLIIRMEGTHVEQGKKILADSGMNIIVIDTLEEAAEKAVLAAKGMG